jgi:hypothetical protein
LVARNIQKQNRAVGAEFRKLRNYGTLMVIFFYQYFAPDGAWKRGIAQVNTLICDW